ncbi:hypothetical protein GUITHDRAFT_66907 [Guillardia theta CCMP2712]|uniref:[histone H3]-lysine(4) N-trimethyltransferase n=2 Tax=Guillardia theta TaxID=55529 RepID=L1JQ61_GUITC|nr:hypothetical protein GUITHDRAFT_66907 [Guillardia theta CCMP2712]EKX50607.1 hypothetical protein GUITHDRAFT_66907 [Guillardia theta CCMP2712]|eukprot:XP_005837587.1 hypothetical protein GUITHDRAFT_66907 [Guillardia theta CCMP2712]
MSTAKVLRNAENEDARPDVANVGKPAKEEERSIKAKYLQLRSEPRTVVRRSPIHNLGLFATRRIDRNDMVIEYVGELIRPIVGDIRDDLALEKGKSTYMFRLDDNYIVDAMFAGNASRFINHCCDPNCYCQVVTVDGVKHIVLFAMRDIEADEEITYDYKLPIEEVKVICHCGSAKCRGYMN